jgi:2-C-methyl-D-erythritol 4-phosphate cytidylyltransferase
VDGEFRNLKITVPDDLAVMRALLGMKAAEGRAIHKRF